MNIESLNDKTAEQLFHNLDVHTVADLYSVKKEQLLTLDGFKGEKGSELNRWNKRNQKMLKLANFIFALGINNVGLKTARDLDKVLAA